MPGRLDVRALVRDAATACRVGVRPARRSSRVPFYFGWRAWFAHFMPRALLLARGAPGGGGQRGAGAALRDRAAGGGVLPRLPAVALDDAWAPRWRLLGATLGSGLAARVGRLRAGARRHGARGYAARRVLPRAGLRLAARPHRRHRRAGRCSTCSATCTRRRSAAATACTDGLRGAALFDMDRTLVRKETASLYVRYMRRRGGGERGGTPRASLWWVAQYTFGVIDAPAVAGQRAAVARGDGGGGARGSVATTGSTRDVLPHVRERGTAHSRASPRERRRRRHRHRGEPLHGAPARAPPGHPARRRERARGRSRRRDSRGATSSRSATATASSPAHAASPSGSDSRWKTRTFYTDSLTDLPLLEAVRTPVAINPDPRLSRLARRRGWRVERW